MGRGGKIPASFIPQNRNLAMREFSRNQPRGVLQIRIITLPINDLIPAAYNPRKDLKPGDAEYEKLKKSIIEFDYIDPIIYNERTGLVVGGHQRLKILRDLGRTEIDVSVVDLPEDKEKVLNIALNKISGDWNIGMLKDVLGWVG